MEGMYTYRKGSTVHIKGRKRGKLVVGRYCTVYNGNIHRKLARITYGERYIWRKVHMEEIYIQSRLHV